MSDHATDPGILIIGGGVSGLACGATLAAHGLPFTLHERAARVGGHARTEAVGAFRFDRGPHVLLGIPDELGGLFARLALPVEQRSCESTIYFDRFDRLHVPAPLQANLGPLPLEARLRCAAGLVCRGWRRRRPARDHREQAAGALGRGLVEIFAEPYAQKRLAMAMADIHPLWTSRIAAPRSVRRCGTGWSRGGPAAGSTARSRTRRPVASSSCRGRCSRSSRRVPSSSATRWSGSMPCAASRGSPAARRGRSTPSCRASRSTSCWT